MKASRFAETVALIGLVLGCIVMLNSRGGMFNLGMLVAIGSVVWYFGWGAKLSGWVGPRHEEMEADLRRIEQELEQIKALPEGPERYKRESALEDKRYSINSRLIEYRKSVAAEGTSPPAAEDEARRRYALDLIGSTPGYWDIFQRGSAEQQAAKVREIAEVADELQAIDAWIEQLKSKPIEQREQLRAIAAHKIQRKTQILLRVMRPFGGGGAEGKMSDSKI